MLNAWRRFFYSYKAQYLLRGVGSSVTSKQKIAAQITAVDSDFVKLTVLHSSIIENIVGTKLKPLNVGSTITKKRATLLRAETGRLLWSEEDVRKALLGRVPN